MHTLLCLKHPILAWYALSDFGLVIIRIRVNLWLLAVDRLKLNFSFGISKVSRMMAGLLICEQCSVL